MALTPQEKSNLVKVGLGVALVVAGAIFMPGMGINETRTAIAALDRQIADEQKKLDEMRATAAQLPRLREETARLRPEIEAQERRLPKSENPVELFRDLNLLGAKNGIKFDALERVAEAPTGGRGQQERPEDRGYAKIPIRIQLHVDYHGLGRFINDLESGERFLRIDDLTINNGEERLAAGRDWSVQNVEMRLATFRFVEAEKKPEETPAAGATSTPRR